METIVFLGSYPYTPAELRLYWDNYPCLSISLVRYADDDVTSPSCCDWLIPGTFNDEIYC